MALNAQQQSFVVAYAECGNAAEAARRAGYSEKTARVKGSQLLTILDVQEAVKKLSAEKMSVDIATAEDRQRFWTDVMKSDSVEMKDRLKASELLGRRQGDFIERREVKSQILIVDESDDG